MMDDFSKYNQFNYKSEVATRKGLSYNNMSKIIAPCYQISYIITISKNQSHSSYKRDS
jgi:hypothetical protein